MSITTRNSALQCSYWVDDYVGWRDLGSDLRLGLEVIVQVIISVIRVKRDRVLYVHVAREYPR